MFQIGRAAADAINTVMQYERIVQRVVKVGADVFQIVRVAAHAITETEYQIRCVKLTAIDANSVIS